MLRKITVTFCLLATSMVTQASLISHYGYERDSASNVVIGGGLEWLKWDVTKGISVNTALSTYSANGWRLATNAEMANLFNAFKFGKNNWVNSNSTNQLTEKPWSRGDSTDEHNQFIKLFGATFVSSCSTFVDIGWCYSDLDPYEFTHAFYGSNHHGDDYVSSVALWGDSTVIDMGIGIKTIYKASWAGLYSEGSYGKAKSSSDKYTGVSLVRTTGQSHLPVTIPGSIGLLVLGLVALGVSRRKALRS